MKNTVPGIPPNSILGLNYSGMHDSAIAVVSPKGDLLFACALERITRIKQDGRPPLELLSALPLKRFRAIAVSTNAQLPSAAVTYSGIHPVRLSVPRSTHLVHGPQFKRFLDSIPLSKEYVDHHLCHAHSAFWMSGFSSALCLTYDGGMCNSPWFGGIYFADRKKGIFPLDLFSAAHHAKITSLYSFVTALLGFTPNKHEGKITGLAAYGKPSRACLTILEELFTKDFSAVEEIAEWMFMYSTDAPPVLAVNEPNRRKLLNRFKGIRKEDIAASVQHLAEEHVLTILRNARKQGYVSDAICLAGGLFANVKINQRVKEFGFKRAFVVPPMTDDGTALGAALFVASKKRAFKPKQLSHVFLGPSYSTQKIKESIRSYSLNFQKVQDPTRFLAQKLAEGATVAVFQGAMEFGPRALGNRSILSQATRPEINRELNVKLNRTEFMPFAPMTRIEDLESCYTGLNGAEHSAEFMTITSGCTRRMRKQSPAVVHVDGTARPQIVTRDKHPFVHDLISRYKQLTGIPSIINTSFNIHEEPIVCSPSDAIEGFLESGIDFLYFEGGILLTATANQNAALKLLRNKRRKPSQKESKLQALGTEYLFRLHRAFADLDEKENERRMQQKVLLERADAIAEKEAHIRMQERMLLSKEKKINTLADSRAQLADAIRAQDKELKAKENEIKKVAAEAEKRLVELQKITETVGKAKKAIADLRSSMTAMEKSLREKEAQIRLLSTARQEQDKVLLEREKMLREKDEAISATSEEARKRLEDLHRVTQAVEQERDASARLQSAILAMEQGLKQKEDQIGQLAHARDDLTSVLAEHDVVLKDKEQQIDMLASSLDDLRAALLERDAALKEKERQIQDLSAAAEALRRTLDEREKALVEKENEIVRQNETRKNLDSVLTERDKALTGKEQAIGEIAWVAESRLADNQKLSGSIEALRREAAGLRSEIEHLQKSAKEKEHQIGTLADSRDALERSLNKREEKLKKTEDDLAAVSWKAELRLAEVQTLTALLKEKEAGLASMNRSLEEQARTLGLRESELARALGVSAAQKQVLEQLIRDLESKDKELHAGLAAIASLKENWGYRFARKVDAITGKKP